MGLGPHQGKLAAHIILDTLQLLTVVAPCKDIAVRTDGSESLAVRLIQILLNPFTVDLVGTAVTGQRVHVACGLLELPQVLRRIVYEEILVHNIAAREQYPYRCNKRQAAVAAVQEVCDGILILHLLGDDEPAREGIEAACRAAVFLSGL